MSAAAHAPLDRHRLALILGMLGSAHDGEIAAAGRRAAAIVHAAGVSWDDLLNPPMAFPAPPGAPLNVDAVLRAALMQPGRLSAWEIGFVRDLAGWRQPLSDRQRGVLARIADKVGLRR